MPPDFLPVHTLYSNCGMFPASTPLLDNRIRTKLAFPLDLGSPSGPLDFAIGYKFSFLTEAKLQSAIRNLQASSAPTLVCGMPGLQEQGESARPRGPQHVQSQPPARRSAIMPH
ncbi:hypothetical protein CONPUDRAFT_160047 [Coniophora puteana RWD-64-598 SS2]|uniref:Uncharacterized protein n=1 Tax=Coniophora puteana (strain RWD-64-598) TaxID=741705 RepID=R7SF18_CONPW|nr:uncharacterized protein CONPUDRAFT_160047 [Coniophora puteana RWD-64-598 SS2]EIW74337.1 hypothetical protein CONPUDRAFT_160047 [Coniophora puteana RWD-64-598 SS2]